MKISPIDIIEGVVEGEAIERKRRRPEPRLPCENQGWMTPQPMVADVNLWPVDQRSCRHQRGSGWDGMGCLSGPLCAHVICVKDAA